METAPTTTGVPSPRSPARELLVVAAVAGAVRLVWVWAAARDPVGLSDPILYLDAGSSIAEGRGYTSLLGEPTAYYPPGYPFFVGAVTRLATAVGAREHVVPAIGTVQALLGALTAATVCWIAWRILAPRGQEAARRGGLVAGLAVAFWPNLVVHSGLVLSETLFLALYAVLLAALVEWTLDPSSSASPSWTSPRGVAAVIVVSAAGATWVRPQSVALLLPALALAWVVLRSDRRRLVLGLVWVAVGLAVAVLPWTVRNAVVLDAVVPMSTNTGDNLCIGFNDGADGTFDLTDDCATEGRYVDGADIEVARDAELRDRALAWIREHPGQVPRLAAQKLAATFVLDTDGVAAWESYGQDRHLGAGARSFARWTANLVWWVLASAAVLGAAVGVRDRRLVPGVAVLLASAATTVLTPMLFFGDERFKMPVAPVVAVLVGVAVAVVLSRRDAALPGVRR